MRHIVVMNAKGGCGKSTLATNIASYFANEGASVALADYDPQRSSLDWLDRRPADKAAIAGVAGRTGNSSVSIPVTGSFTTSMPTGPNSMTSLPSDRRLAR